MTPSQGVDTGSSPVGPTKVMEEKEYVRRCLWEWAQAKAVSKENPAWLIRTNFASDVMQECVDRMKRLEVCEEELFSLTHDLPSPLQNHIDARMDRGCWSCWLSSAGPKHQECARKIDRYFRTEEDLFYYAQETCDPAKNLTDFETV